VLKSIPPARQADQLYTYLGHLYQTEVFRQKILPLWLKDPIDPQRVQATSAAVRQIGANFGRLALLIKRINERLETSSLFQDSILASTGYALQVGLLGVLIFAGYDHLDEGSVALNITQGIKETLITQLPISAETRLASEFRSR
jgi:hypothetical protein